MLDASSLLNLSSLQPCKAIAPNWLQASLVIGKYVGLSTEDNPKDTYKEPCHAKVMGSKGNLRPGAKRGRLTITALTTE